MTPDPLERNRFISIYVLRFRLIIGKNFTSRSKLKYMFVSYFEIFIYCDFCFDRGCQKNFNST